MPQKTVNLVNFCPFPTRYLLNPAEKKEKHVAIFLSHVAGFCVNFLYLFARIICPFDWIIPVLQRLKIQLRRLHSKIFGNGI